ncbi:MAG TPA: zf-HC2 domain-containing protein [Pseudonocardiaceae bacterium]
MDVECQVCREALSARLDGEAEPVDPARADRHLRGCSDCRAWREDSVMLTRLLRVRPAVDTPDLTTRVLAAALRLRRWWRA